MNSRRRRGTTDVKSDSIDRIPINAQEDIVHARKRGRETARELGFGYADQTRLATAISELARNTLTHAGSGVCEIGVEQAQDTGSVVVVVTDSGPGIADVEAAMRDGFSTSDGLGMGLPGTKRLVDDFHLESRPGQTKIRVVMTRTLR